MQFITTENKIYMVRHIISIIDDYFTAYIDKMEILKPVHFLSKNHFYINAVHF